MKRFNKETYLDILRQPNGSNIRILERGLSGFMADIYSRADELTASQEHPLSICEIGIGGGGSQHNISRSTNNTKIFGIDVFSKYQEKLYNTHDGYNYMRDHFERLTDDQEISERMKDGVNDTSTSNNMYLFHGIDGYSERAATRVTLANTHPLDVLVDDGSPVGSTPYARGKTTGVLLDSWKSKMSKHGVIVSGTLFGNGTEEVTQLDSDPNWLPSMSKHASENGWMVFDLSEYRPTVENPQVVHMISYMCMWAADWDLYSDIIEKYKHNITHYASTYNIGN